MQFDYKKFNEVLINKGLTLKELSEKCGLGQDTLSRYKHNKIRPGTKNFGKLVKALECDIKDLMV